MSALDITENTSILNLLVAATIVQGASLDISNNTAILNIGNPGVN